MKEEAESPRREQAAGRMCPRDYYYDPAVFDHPADMASDVLYVVGGVYGNLAAIDQLEVLIDAERGKTVVVFNGDSHWFDADPSWFDNVERRIAPYRAIRGNVETEISRTQDIGAGSRSI